VGGILYERNSTAQYKVAAAVVALIGVATAAMAPFAPVELPVIVPFVPIFSTTVIMAEGLTAFLLAVQFRATSRAFLGGLVGAYGFELVVAIIQLVIFPGVFTKDGLLGAGPQSAIWLWVIWHGGFAVMVLLALATRSTLAARWFGASLPRAGTVLMAGGPLLATILSFGTIRFSSALPPLISHGAYAALGHGPLRVVVISLLVLALAACVRITRLRDLVGLWLAVALLASIGDSTLVMMAGARFSLGWYGGRLLTMVSSSTVLCALVFEFTLAYQRLLRANDALQHRVMHDALTGAFNRLYFAEQLPRELRRAIREHTPLSVVMIDVDHFKQFNDCWGHARGDDCLIAVVERLQSVLRRPADFLARYGGEEFVAVLPQTGPDGAIAMAEALRHAVIDLALRRGAASDGVVTVSLGITTVDPRTDAITTDTILQRADAALYEAKHAGRNRIATWAPSGQGHRAFEAPVEV
jgi:diguanylate cyclase (GGDEF)-like protein